MTTWVRLDDDMPRKQRVIDLSDAAFRLYVASICHCGHETTDGLVSFAAARMLTPSSSTRVANELVKAGLWECDPDGYRVARYLDYQESSGRALRARAAARERMRRLRSGERSPERTPEQGGGK